MQKTTMESRHLPISNEDDVNFTIENAIDEPLVIDEQSNSRLQTDLNILSHE
jgi:hypothetical protein